MTTRTTRSVAVFNSAFTLGGIDGELPAGSYRIESEEELIESLSFVAFRRVETTIELPAIGSARSAPDQKHALKAPWDNWVLPIPVVDRLLHGFPFALSNLVKRALLDPLVPMRPVALVRDTHRRAPSAPMRSLPSCWPWRRQRSWSCAVAEA